MRMIHTLGELRQWRNSLRPQSLGLVPTMGALHDGHETLIRHSILQNEATVVSIYVNPTQFNRPDDFSRYPRDPAADAGICERLGVDAVWAPDDQQMYPRPLKTVLDIQDLTAHLCGPFRPGHFRGVATVVAKLFLQVQPDRAYFGEKDAQQLAIIRRMVRDLDFPLEVVPVPTVRETDGLALSSRNRLLSADDRAAAPVLYRALTAARDAIAGGERRADEVRRTAMRVMAQAPALRLEYFELVDPESLQPVQTIEGPTLIAVAGWLGATRLIDNLLACPPG